MQRIENYALLVDTRTAALVSDQGSIDWLCPPRVDSTDAPLAALLDSEEGGRWEIAPCREVLTMRRRYRRDTLIFETELDTIEGSIRIVDFVPQCSKTNGVVRLVEGVRGQVRVHMDLRLPGDAGRMRPRLCTAVETCAVDAAVVADFVVAAGELVPIALTWQLVSEPALGLDPFRLLADTERFWAERVSV